MNNNDVRAASFALAQEVGPNAEVYPSFSIHGHQSEALTLAIYPNGVCKEPRFEIYADDLDTLFARGKAECEARGDEFAKKLVRQMALRVIELTADFGSCSVSQLRGAQFSDEQVKFYGAMACAEADQIASNGPFAIIEERGANAA